MNSLDGKTALITGAARGIGKGIAEMFCEAGAAVVIGDIDHDGAAKTAAELTSAGHQAVATPLDVREPDSVDRAIATVISEFGGLDILVNNAVHNERRPFLEFPLDLFDHMMRTNLTGYFICAQAAARLMVKQNRGGRVINISSNSGLFGGRGRVAYSATKAGIIGLTQSMAVELAEHRILVNAIAPGPIKTEAVTAAIPTPAFADRMSIKRFGSTHEIGCAAVFLASDMASFTTGHVLTVDGGLTTSGIMEG